MRQCPPDLGVWADPAKTTQILVNLLANALRHTPAGTPIEVYAEPAPGGRLVRLAVRDIGPGIPADKQERIFEPFVQVHDEFTRNTEGLGLGLAIARDLARGMDGELTVESHLGIGTTFTLTLPLTRHA